MSLYAINYVYDFCLLVEEKITTIKPNGRIKKPEGVELLPLSVSRISFPKRENWICFQLRHPNNTYIIAHQDKVICGNIKNKTAYVYNVDDILKDQVFKEKAAKIVKFTLCNLMPAKYKQKLTDCLVEIFKNCAIISNEKIDGKWNDYNFYIEPSSSIQIDDKIQFGVVRFEASELYPHIENPIVIYKDKDNFVYRKRTDDGNKTGYILTSAQENKILQDLEKDLVEKWLETIEVRKVLQKLMPLIDKKLCYCSLVDTCQYICDNADKLMKRNGYDKMVKKELKKRVFLDKICESYFDIYGGKLVYHKNNGNFMSELEYDSGVIVVADLEHYSLYCDEIHLHSTDYHAVLDYAIEKHCAFRIFYSLDNLAVNLLDKDDYYLDEDVDLLEDDFLPEEESSFKKVVKL